MYPQLIIRRDKIKSNCLKLVKRCHDLGISVMGVTKSFGASKELIEIYQEAGVDYLADSRINNLQKLNTSLPKVLIRVPMLSELPSVIDGCDISLNSSLTTIEALNKVANERAKVHKVILMFDLGEGREGIPLSEIKKLDYSSIFNLGNIKIIGLGTNFMCLKKPLPTKDHLDKLLEVKVYLEKKYNLTLEMVSFGNSSVLPLLRDSLDKRLNNLRLGESILLGRETSYGQIYDNLSSETFLLKAQLVEVYPKEGCLQGLLALGNQDLKPEELIPLDKVEVVGSTGDYTIVKLNTSYRVGDILTFQLEYNNLTRAFNNKAIKKLYK